MIAGICLALALQPDPAMLLRLFQESLDQKRREYGMSDARTAGAARDLGLFLIRQNDAPAARQALAEAVQIDETAFGAGDSRTLADAADLAGVSGPLEAEPLWWRASECPDPQVSVRALVALAGSRQAARDPAAASALYRRALAKSKQETQSAVILTALAHVVDAREGIAALERALAINRRALGPRHPETATTEANLAGLLLNANRPEDAIRLLRDALSIFEQTLGPDHPREAVAASMLAYALSSKGDRIHAEQMYRRALTIDEKAYGPQNAQTINDRSALVECLREMGKRREAAEELEKGLSAGPRP